MIQKIHRSSTCWVALFIMLLGATNTHAQSDCNHVSKGLITYLEDMLKGTSNRFYTPRDTHDYVVSQTQKLPEGAEEKEEMLKERYFKYLEDTDADLKTLRNTFRSKGILPGNLRIVGAIETESQIVKSNRPKGFSAPLPKEEQIHLEITSTLFVVDNNAGNYSKRMLINVYILENNGYYSVMKVNSNPVSDLADYEDMIKNFRIKLPELLSYASFDGDELRNIHQKGKELAQLQVNGEGSTTVLVKSDEDIRGLLAHRTAINIIIAEGISRTELPQSLNEVQGVLSLFGEGTGYNMNSLTGRIEKENHIRFTYDFISKSAFRKEGDNVIKYFRVCYREGDYSQKSLPARLIISPQANGTYRMDLIAGKTKG